MLDVTVDSKQVEDGLNRLSSTLESSVVQKAVQPVLKQIQVEAQRHHRYTRRTGRLERSIRSTMNRTGGEVFIDDSMADYGKYVHEGFKSWNPDKFLYQAAEKYDKVLDVAVEKAIDDDIKQAGL
jgi:hypothetical protein